MGKRQFLYPAYLLRFNKEIQYLADRYFSGASATPGAVFPRLLKNMRHHISKARDGNYAGTAIWLDRQADEIASQISTFPSFLPLPQQGLFILGYHHQRHALWQKKQSNENE